jgi:hypothetical protein
MLLGVSIGVSPFKEDSPAKIIMNTTDPPFFRLNL